MLCGNAVLGESIIDSDLVFDSEKCRQTYRKLEGVYGHNISDMGLPDILNANFFFIDVVGLTDLSLSVKNQITKIDVLNHLIGTCTAFSTTPKNGKIILPTGDGMAIGFLLNPELPLQLSIQFQEKLSEYNKNKLEEDVIGVRIGLSSGPVFVHNDINNNKNLWGPGMVLARRVMDLGDNLHILIADRLAAELITLRDEYREIIHQITEYEIKHGQIIKLYSVYSDEFGNPNLPEKVIAYMTKKNQK